jgi:hypothetical protein
MIGSIIVAASLAVLFILVGRVIVRQFRYRREPLCLNTAQSQLDIEVLQLLLSRQEWDYLRRSVEESQLSHIKRERTWLAQNYLSVIDRNVRRMIGVVEPAQSSEDPEVAEAARELLHLAFRIRLRMPIARLCLAIEWLFPTLSLPSPLNLSAYGEMVAKIAFILRRLQALPSETTLYV